MRWTRGPASGRHPAAAVAARKGWVVGGKVVVAVRRLENYPAEWALPEYATEGSAAVDLRNAGDVLVLPPLGRHLVPTGLAIALPDGMEAQIRPRSGLALRRGVTIINTPCTIDSDYRGEIRIPMINLDAGAQTIEHGERIAQMLVAEVARIEWQEADTLPATER
ncbi:MAG TPA: dUTP diphosphatase, partial [Longimicrobiales bacterium]|nr:dUTP diphosphatase [Longimicrobiales bacterium]